MSQEITTAIQSMFELIDSAQWPELEKHFHDDVLYFRPGYEPIIGLNDLLDFYMNRRIIMKGKHILETFCSARDGNTVSAVGSFTGVDKQGKALKVRFCDIYQIESGKIRRRETFFDRPAV
jgi:ketosteroid isomerase-like protein